MSLRSPFPKHTASASPSSARLGFRFSWAGLAAVVGVLTVSATGCGGCGDNNTLQCEPGGKNCQICDAYGCRPANPDTLSGSGGASGAGGATTASGSGGAKTGTGGSTATTTTSTGASTGTTTGTGGSTTGLSCNSQMPCPTPQVCEADGFCHYPCADLQECKLYDNRFVACVGGVCKTQQELGDGGM
jgi:hypothetical protein